MIGSESSSTSAENGITTNQQPIATNNAAVLLAATVRCAAVPTGLRRCVTAASAINDGSIHPNTTTGSVKSA